MEQKKVGIIGHGGLGSTHVGVDLAEEQDRAVSIVYVNNEDGTLTRIGTTDDKLPEFKSSNRPDIGSLKDMAEEQAVSFRKKMVPLEMAQSAYHHDGRSARNIRRAKERNNKKGK